MALNILFVASELAPIAKVGGLGDVMEGLPRALNHIGVSARIVIPYYAQIHKQIATRKRFSFSVGDTMVWLREARLGGVTAYFIECEPLFGKGAIYADRSAFTDTDSEIKKFGFFSDAVFALLNERRFWKPDVVHCNDWHTGPLTQALKEKGSTGKNLRTVFTIHNLQNQGATANRNPMRDGIMAADIVTTVSPTYANEILTAQYGCGLQKMLAVRAKEGKLKGILNGVDYAYWPNVKRNKWEFQKKLGLSQNASIPLFGFTARLTDQKGVDLILPVAEALAKKEQAQFVFLGQGSAEFERLLLALSKQYSTSISVNIGFDEKLAHAIYAHTDFFLMPSLFEPCGLGQMIAMHYATPPIVRATGGLKDSVRNRQTGLVFQKAHPEEFVRVIKAALRLYADKKAFVRMQQLCAQQDFSWRASALEYKKMYKKITP